MGFEHTKLTPAFSTRISTSRVGFFYDLFLKAGNGRRSVTVLLCNCPSSLPFVALTSPFKRLWRPAGLAD